jgi:hypothetical protein
MNFDKLTRDDSDFAIFCLFLYLQIPFKLNFY